MGKHRSRRTPTPLVAVPLVAVPVAVALALGSTGETPPPVHAAAGQSIAYGADGTVPDGTGPAAGVETATQAAAPPGAPAIPPVALRGYAAAAQLVSVTHPGCGLTWPLLAAIGQAQSGHAAATGFDTHGDTVAPDLGPVMDGAGGRPAVRDTDGGVWDGDTHWDRPVGPMRLLPAVWAEHGRDASGDGVAIPHNVADAALATARYLCATGADLTDPRERAEAVYRFHGTTEFVGTVLAWRSALDPSTPKTTTAAPKPKPSPKPKAAPKPAPQPKPVAPAPAQQTAPRPTTQRPAAPAPRPAPADQPLPGEQWYDWGKWIGR